MKSVCLLTAGSLLCVGAAIGEETKEAQEPEVVQKERFAAEDTDPGDGGDVNL